MMLGYVLTIINRLYALTKGINLILSTHISVSIMSKHHSLIGACIIGKKWKVRVIAIQSRPKPTKRISHSSIKRAFSKYADRIELPKGVSKRIKIAYQNVNSDEDDAHMINNYDIYIPVNAHRIYIYMGTWRTENYMTHRTLASFEMHEYPNCCAMIIFTHAWVTPELRGLGLGSLLHRWRLYLAELHGYSIASCTMVTESEYGWDYDGDSESRRERQRAILEHNGWRQVEHIYNPNSGNYIVQYQRLLHPENFHDPEE